MKIMQKLHDNWRSDRNSRPKHSWTHWKNWSSSLPQSKWSTTCSFPSKKQTNHSKSLIQVYSTELARTRHVTLPQIWKPALWSRPHSHIPSPEITHYSIQGTLELTKLGYRRTTDHGLSHFTYQTRVKVHVRQKIHQSAITAVPTLPHWRPLSIQRNELCRNKKTRHCRWKTHTATSGTGTYTTLKPLHLYSSTFRISTNHWENLAAAELAALQAPIKVNCCQDHIYCLDSAIEANEHAFATRNFEKHTISSTNFAKNQISHIILTTPRTEPMLHTTRGNLCIVTANTVRNCLRIDSLTINNLLNSS